MARPAKKIDTAAEIVARIMNEPIPADGHLIHPLQAKSREKQTGQITANAVTQAKRRLVNEAPLDTGTWSARNWVDNFAERYNRAFGGNYRKRYIGDCPTFQSMLSFMSSYGLSRGEGMTLLLDWAFAKREWIIRRRTHFTPQTIESVINEWYQEVIMPRVEVGTVERVADDISLLEEIAEADAKGRLTEIFARHGIPVAATYYAQNTPHTAQQVADGLAVRLKELNRGSLEDRKTVERIIIRSVMGSPYPTGFSLLDWRIRFPDIVKLYERESWWRDLDYRGISLPKYNALVTSNR